MRRPDPRTVGTGVGAGLLMAASLPPWGWWPLAFPGIVLLDRFLAGQSVGHRFKRGFLVGVALLCPTMFWISDLTAPGYLIAVLAYSAMLGLAMMAVPPGGGRHVALPAAWVLWEAWRGAWPFGGVPLSSLAIGQVGGPLVGVARLGGTLLLSGVALTLGVSLAAAIRRDFRIAPGGAVLVVLAVSWAAVAPHGYNTGRSIKVAFVQGGGPQGTRALDTDPSVVFNRHMAASKKIPAGVDLVVWPEDVVDTDGYVMDYTEGQQLAALAGRTHALLTAGVVETADDTHFRNAQMMWDETGTVIDRYEKVHRVPFGEWVPLRGLIESVAPNTLPQRDAIIGTGPPTLTTPKVKLGVVISWEVFFGHRARSAIGHGGEILLNPTNGASFTGTEVQTQQIASSRLRAIETGRWVVQVAPTGFSAFITPSGKVLERTGVSERAVRTHDVALRHGLTLYNQWGEWPTLIGSVLAVLSAWLIDRRQRPVEWVPALAGPTLVPTQRAVSVDLEHEGDGAIVDQLDGHVGAEAARGDGGPE